MQWLVTNTRPDLAADVSLSAGQVTGNTLNDIKNLIKIIRKAKRDETLPITIQVIPIEQVTFGGFGDAAHGVRPDGSSQGGVLIICAPQALWDGDLAPTSCIDRKSWKLKRVCRSSLAAEAQAISELVDMLNFMRLFFLEFLLRDGVNLRSVDETL